MKDSDLVKVSFIVSTVGLVMLFFVSAHSKPSLVKISEIDYDSVGSRAVVEGEILSKRVHEDGHIFLKVSDSTGKISVVIFNNVARKLDEEKMDCISAGSYIQAAGEIEEYRGNLEIVPKSEGDVMCWKPSSLP